MLKSKFFFFNKKNQLLKHINKGENVLTELIVIVFQHGEKSVFNESDRECKLYNIF